MGTSRLGSERPVSGRVSNMKEQRYAANVRVTTEQECRETGGSAGAGGETVTQTERDRHGGQRSFA